ncbi:hypothetical protein [Actinospica sp.]|uniref:hypothetical protein n=1 Tax=Actinospica sp. TaxID=1872142 RepID=UPI002C20C647|nr:hypothetical protein [Actinospica sp.]HWG28115.1 hypothetical protein [Actinospica sp.]
MGKGARRITRWSTAIVLVGAVCAGTAETAFGYADGGVNIPDSTFRQGTGTQQVAVSVGHGVVGTDQTLIVWPFYSSDYHWLVGVAADPGTGATCSYDVGQWQCVPGRGGWLAGNLHVLVDTAKAMDCGLHAGVCQNDEINIQSLPDPGDRNGLPDGQPLSVLGNVLIMPDSVPWHGPTPQPAYREPLATSSASGQVAGVSATPTRTTPVTSTSPDPATSIAAVNTSLTSTPDASPTGLYLALAIPILLGAGAPLAYRMRKRRRQASGE